MGVMGDKQVQNAGDASTQMQAGIINVYNGIDEKRARGIVDEKVQELMSTYTFEAHEVMKTRIEKFADALVPKLVKQNLLDCLADPSIQILLLEASKSAASTERAVDTELLSELLIHRIEKGENRNVRAGISRAVKIVDEISDDALLGLTVLHTIMHYRPVCYQLDDGLKILSNLFGSITYGQLPQGSKWLEHLDILDAIRIMPFTKNNSIKEIYTNSMSGITDVGIAKSSESYKSAIEILEKANLSETLLIPHDLRDGYVRLGILNIERLDLVQLVENDNGILNMQKARKLNEEQKQAYRDVYELYEKDEMKLQANKDAFMERWNSYDSLRVINEWWNSINDGLSITSIGEALAHANAKRCEPQLPEIE